MPLLPAFLPAVVLPRAGFAGPLAAGVAAPATGGDALARAATYFLAVGVLLGLFVLVVAILMVVRRRRARAEGTGSGNPAPAPDAWEEAGRRARPLPRRGDR